MASLEMKVKVKFTVYYRLMKIAFFILKIVEDKPLLKTNINGKWKDGNVRLKDFDILK